MFCKNKYFSCLKFENVIMNWNGTQISEDVETPHVNECDIKFRFN